MIHLIHSGNRRFYDRECAALDLLRRGRRNSFGNPGEKGEEAAGSDAFDLVAFAPNGALAASLRLRPTQNFSVIADVFAHLIPFAEESLKGPATYEVTDYHLAPFTGAARGLSVRSMLHVAMLEAMQDRQAQRLVALVDIEFTPHLREGSGLRLRPIGVPAPLDHGALLAFEIEVGAQDLAWARASLNIHTRQLFEAQPSGLDEVSDARPQRVGFDQWSRSGAAVRTGRFYSKVLS